VLTELESQLNLVQEHIKNKSEWLGVLEQLKAKEVEELRIMMEARQDLETSLHILKHIQGRTF
jgi:hypothetical protein